MTRLSLCALAVALAAGHSLAVPTNVEHGVHHFGEMEGFQDNTTREETTTPTKPSAPETPEQWMEAFVKAVQKQLHLQDSLMKRLMKDIQDYLTEMSKVFNWEDSQTNAFNKVNEMMEMINNRMATAIEGTNDLMANSENLDTDALRGATNKFMKEVRVQDVVVDALWASLRGVQTSAWMTGINTDKEETSAAANRAAEEFITRMYQNLRAAGMSDEDIVKFIPKTEASTFRDQGRNMGMKSSGWGYGGWGYPSYGYGWGYPHYGYGWGYPHYGYGHWRRLRPSTCPDCPPTPVTGMPTEQIVPPFRAMGEMMMGQGNTTPMMGQGNTTPMMGQGNTTPMMGQGNTTPMMGQGYTTPMMGQGYTTPMMGQGNTTRMMGQGYTSRMLGQAYTTRMMGQGYTTPMVGNAMTSEYPTIFEQNMGYPSTRMNAMDITTPFATNYNTPYDTFMPTTTAYTGGYRNLAPLNEVPMPGAFPETGMRSTPFGFGPTGEMLF